MASKNKKQTNKEPVVVNNNDIDQDDILTEEVEQNVNEQELPNLIKQFILIQTNILELKKQIKTYNSQFKHIQQQIIQFMQSKHLQNIDTQYNILSIRNTNITKHISLPVLSSYFNKQLNIPMEALQNFVDQLPSKTQHTLIIKPK